MSVSLKHVHGLWIVRFVVAFFSSLREFFIQFPRESDENFSAFCHIHDWSWSLKSLNNLMEIHRCTMHKETCVYIQFYNHRTRMLKNILQNVERSSNKSERNDCRCSFQIFQVLACLLRKIQFRAENAKKSIEIRQHEKGSEEQEWNEKENISNSRDEWKLSWLLEHNGRRKTDVK